jgi:hypothetical protein
MDTNNDGDDGDELSTLETEIQRFESRFPKPLVVSSILEATMIPVPKILWKKKVLLA